MKALKLWLTWLECGVGTGWESYKNVPLDQWPNAALRVFLRLRAAPPDAVVLQIAEADAA